MTRTPNLRKLYKAILSYLWLDADEHGEVVTVKSPGETAGKFFVDEKLVLLPTEENLRRFELEKHLIFHPLREHIDRGESDLLKALRHRFNTRVNVSLLALMMDLLGIAADSDVQRDLSPEQRDLLLGLPAVTFKDVEAYSRVVSKHFLANSTRFFANVYLKKAGTYKGERHARVGVVQFPFYELMKDPAWKLTEEQIEAFTKVFEFIFPASQDDHEAFNWYSDDRDAPWMDCFLQTSARLAERVGELQELYADYVSDREKLTLDLSWRPYFDNLEAIRKEILLIPSQAGNNGDSERAVQAQAAARPTPAPTLQSAPAPTAPVQAPVANASGLQPVPDRQPAPRMPYDPNYRAAPAQPQYPQPPYPYPPQPGYPVQPQQPQPPAAPMTTPDGKLDFNSVLASNPQVAQAGGIETPLNSWGQHQNQYMQPQANQPPMLWNPNTGRWEPDMRYAQPQPVRGGWGGGYQGGGYHGPYGGGYGGVRNV